MLNQLRIAVTLFLLLTLVTGVVYPLVITGIAQVVFPHAANGSVIKRAGRAIGSELIGQPFDDPRYFWPRPSATGPTSYNGAASTGSNYGPTNPAQLEAVRTRAKVLRAAHGASDRPVPIDLVTASGSGLDPHITPAAADYQVSRVGAARNLDEQVIRKLIEETTEGRQLGVLGEPRINVLILNLELDRASQQ